MIPLLPMLCRYLTCPRELNALRLIEISLVSRTIYISLAIYWSVFSRTLFRSADADATSTRSTPIPRYLPTLYELEIDTIRATLLKQLSMLSSHGMLFVALLRFPESAVLFCGHILPEDRRPDV